MIIVIDGYNLLKYRNPDSFIEDKVRDAFLHTIARYAKRKKHKIVVVFDGGPYIWPHKEKVGGVTVIFSGSKESADEVIMHYLDDHHNKEVLLVSSDHELNLFASSRDFVSIGSDEFDYLVKLALKEKNQFDHQEVKFDEEETDFDIIMQQATEYIMPKEEDKQKMERRKVRFQDSKNDKKLMRTLKKL